MNQDLNGEDFVGIEDLNTVLGNWNGGTPPGETAVPEPGSFVLLVLSGLSLVGRSRSRR